MSYFDYYFYYFRTTTNIVEKNFKKKSEKSCLTFDRLKNKTILDQENTAGDTQYNIQLAKRCLIDF